MEKISSKEEFLERIKELRAVEIKARDEYLFDYQNLSDEKLKSTFLRIKEDEDNHIIFLDEIISLLENH